MSKYIKRDEFLRKYQNRSSQKNIYHYGYIAGRTFLDESYKHINTDENYDVFISYNKNDKEIANSLKIFLEDTYDYNVYVDYEDEDLKKENFDNKIAKIFANKLQKCRTLIFIYSHFSKKSKWCPWELGVLSGLNNFNCLILPIIEVEDDEFSEQEYLMLYPKLTYNKTTTGKGPYLWVHKKDGSESINLNEWVDKNGRK